MALLDNKTSLKDNDKGLPNLKFEKDSWLDTSISEWAWLLILTPDPLSQLLHGNRIAHVEISIMGPTYR